MRSLVVAIILSFVASVALAQSPYAGLQRDRSRHCRTSKSPTSRLGAEWAWHCPPNDRGWGKAAQLVAVDGEIRQLVEVKLNVVHSAPARDIDATCEPVALEYKNNSDDQQILNMLVDRATRAILSNSSGGFGSFLGPGAGEVLAGGPR
jgi:hypothetical protein